MNSVVRGFSGAVVVLLVMSALASAQATAQLSGTATDESGAVLPGVTVTMTQTATGFTRNVVTETNGAFVISNLPTGPYRLEVSLQGFRTYAADRHRAAGRGHADHQRGPHGLRPGLSGEALHSRLDDVGQRSLDGDGSVSVRGGDGAGAASRESATLP